MGQRKVRIGVAALAALSAESWILPAGAADYSISGGNTYTDTETLAGTDRLSIEPGGKLSVNKKAAINWNDASSDLQIFNAGTIESTKAGGRAIDATGSDNTRTLTLENKTNALIKSDSDAFRINVNPTGGTVTVNNAGTIQSSTKRALDFEAAASGAATITIDNAATGTITSGGDDAIRPGQGATVNNSGTIRTNGQAADKADGIDFKAATAGTVNNNDSGTISGARHGVTLSGSNGAGSVTVNNAANATITGRNGSGVGSDAGGTVTNYGTIEGAYSGNGTQDGDGDGVDIDFAGTIENHGTIKGTGAGGNDKNGRANNSEGISLGGGTITNSGTISGAAYGIVVNNDSNPDNSRSGAAATTITNDVGGTIEGKGGYAIRLENKTGTAADADTIVNKGTIIGNGTIPDPSGVVLLKDGRVDGGSVGTLDGVRYTGTGAARFIRGDGAAIQMGEGDDVLTNYGTITGDSGRAISLEGGNDILNLFTGSTITGRIDGGTGSDTLNLDKAATGPGTGTLANVVNFEALNVKGGAWALTDDHTYARGATVAAGATLTIGNGATAGSLTADIANTGALVFDRSDAASYAGTISGSGSLTKVNTGTLTLSGIHTYTGATTISGGTLALSGAGAVTVSSGVALATGAVLDISGLTGAGTAITALTDTAPGQAGTVALGAKTLAITNANGSFGGTISGSGGLTLAGGTQTLTGANTYTGATTIAHGTLTIQNATALGAADGTAATGTTIVSGAALDLQGGIAVGNEALSLAGMGVNGHGALRSLAGTNSYAGAITLTDTGRITVDAGKLTLSGPITGAAGADRMLVLKGAGDGVIAGDIGGNIGTVAVSDTGGGTWTLTGHSRLDGDLWVLGGGLRIGAGGTVTSRRGLIGNVVDDPGTVTVTGAGSRWTDQGDLIIGNTRSGLLTVADGGVVSSVSGRLGGSTGTTGSVTVTGSGSAWISSDTLVVGGSGTGTLSVAAGGSVSVGPDGTRVLEIAQQNGSTGTLILGAAADRAPVAAGTVQAGEVKFGPGTGTLTFNHTGNPDGTAVTFAPTITGRGRVDHLAGITILIGANTYTGTTTLSGGTLSVANAHALGSSATTVSAGATLDVNGVTLGNALTLAGSGAGGVGALTGTSTAGVSGAITLAGNIALGGTGNLIVSGSIGDGGNRSSLTKIGTGTAILTAANTYGGGTTVAAGTLALGGAGTFGSALATTTITGATSVLDLGGTRQTQAAVSLGQGATLQNGALTAPVTAAGGTVARISGPATLTTTDGTTVSTANTYTGATTIGDGSVLKAGGVGGFSAASPHTLAGTGTLDLAGAANTVGALVSASPATVVTSSAGGPAVLTVAGLSAGSFAGTIRDGVGPLGLTLAGDTLTLTGANTYTGVTTIGRGATLRLGDGGTAGAIVATAGVVNDGALVFDRTDAVSFAPAISGSGSLTQTGGGTTVLTGRNTNTGATTIRGGTLQIDGVLAASEVTVKSGGTLAGSGKIGDPLIEAGGRLAPGSATAIGTLSITGPLTFAPGSFYTVKVTPTANDRTAVTGPVTIQGGTVQVLAGAGTYTPALRYTLLTASGGVTGQFSSLQTTSNLAFLTPSLAYDGHSVSLGFAQTAPLTSVATTLNQGNLAQALNGAGPTVTTTATTGSAPATAATSVPASGTVTTTVSTAGSTTTVVASPAAQVVTAVLNQTAPGAVRALNSLSGEIHASAVTARAQAALAVQGALLEHLRFGAGPASGLGLTGTIGQRLAPGTTLPAGSAAFATDEPAAGVVTVQPLTPGYGLWGQAFGAFGATEGTRNVARLSRETGGFVLSGETGPGVLGDGMGDWRAGVAAGYGFTQFDVRARQSSGQIESGFGAAYASGALGAVRVRLGVMYGSDALDTHRTVLFPGFSQAITGRAGGTTLQSFSEVGYRMGGAARSVEPFVGVAMLRLHQDGLTETGGSAALAVFGRSYGVETVTAGAQAQAIVADLFGGAGPLVARGLIGYRRAFGTVAPAALLAFRGGGTAFRTGGGPLAEDAAVVSAGLDWEIAPGARLGLAYDGQIGRRAQDHAVKGSLSYRW
ncbi:autotransporter-associated beta strand repeat-containing protein [Methylobacterium sp. 1973]|uniref:autotransporter-associated beta strand repeat-containing protein n=1 Tax=Methylobacterium sp. 1973 TaxID=3156421 RepID=UPI003392804C